MRKPKILAYIIVFLIFISIIWISRKILFNYVFDKLIVHTEKRFDLDIEVKHADIKGLCTVYLAGLKITTLQGKPIICSDSIAIDIKLLSLIIGKLRCSSLSVYNSKIYFDAELFRFFKDKLLSKSASDSSIKNYNSINYAGFINNFNQKISEFLPAQIVIRNTSFRYSRDSISAAVTFENFLFNNRKFVGDILFSDKMVHNNCLITGECNTSDYSFTCKVCKSNNGTLKLPYIGPRWHAAFGFDTLMLSCSYKEISDEQSSFTSKASMNNLLVYNKQIGPDTIITHTGNFRFLINIHNNSFELDSISTVQMNNFTFSPYIHFQKDTSKKITIAFIRKEFESNEFFTSLPQGLFSNFSGIETKGRLAYQLRASIDLSDPDSVSFNSKLENLNFSIKKYGVTDFRLMNKTFVHDVYEKDRILTSFAVGMENPDFIPIDQISPFLQYSILTSEDGDFYYHRGFNEKAFRESIAMNIKEGRFARGGSTITMQLVKNVFLNRKKIISRKIEEALIVWIIENLQLTEKDRMFEVYLNIIEWGPGIYGIKAASKFYFNKQPNDLTLAESIYLSSIIPRPKGFKYTFDNNGKIRDYLFSYYKFMSEIMVRRNQIAPEDTINLRPISKLTGEAKLFLSKPDSGSFEDSIYFLKPLELLPHNIVE